jgi:phosphatidylinositol kinase/protein kinase (PI-3  family)
LALRTYNVIPLSPVVGLVQYVTATISLGDFLTGSPEKDFCGMHTRFYPNALTSKEAKNLLQAARQNNHASLLSVYQKICNDIQPVMHQSFLNIFPSPFLWYENILFILRNSFHLLTGLEHYSVIQKALH